MLSDGVAWTLERGYGTSEDRSCIEAEGCIPNADPDMISDRAFERGKNQLGTLGSGNHFLEVGFVKDIYDPVAASAMKTRPSCISVAVCP